MKSQCDSGMPDFVEGSEGGPILPWCNLVMAPLTCVGHRSNVYLGVRISDSDCAVEVGYTIAGDEE